MTYAKSFFNSLIEFYINISALQLRTDSGIKYCVQRCGVWRLVQGSYLKYSSHGVLRTFGGPHEAQNKMQIFRRYLCKWISFCFSLLSNSKCGVSAALWTTRHSLKIFWIFLSSFLVQTPPLHFWDSLFHHLCQWIS